MSGRYVFLGLFNSGWWAGEGASRPEESKTVSRAHGLGAHRKVSKFIGRSGPLHRNPRKFGRPMQPQLSAPADKKGRPTGATAVPTVGRAALAACPLEPQPSAQSPGGRGARERAAVARQAQRGRETTRGLPRETDGRETQAQAQPPR